MKKKSKYRLYSWLMIISGFILAITLTITSIKITSAGKYFTQMILKEHRFFLASALGFGHGLMMHMKSQDYQKLIDLALECESIRYLAIIDKNGEIIAQSKPINRQVPVKKEDLPSLKDGQILKEAKYILYVSYRARELRSNEKHMKHHHILMGHSRITAEPEWFVVGLDTSNFKKHYRDMVIHTLGTGAAFLLIGSLIIIFLAIIQRYELAHLSIEKLNKIKRLLGHFVPETAKQIIEKEPDKKGILNKYIQDATVLFLDIEGFTLLIKKYSQERINRVIEHYFSLFLEVIQKNGGDINETAGDGMMVIFLDPDPIEHARKAIQTGLEIFKECQIASDTKDSGLFPIRVNVGIHSGEVYLGSTKMRGEEGERWTFTASGRVTIMAARLAQYAHKGQILVGDETAQRIGGYFELVPLGKILLKNIEDSGEIYQASLPEP